MARRSRSSAFEDLIELAAMLPWWLALGLAPVAYFLIHPYAVMDVPPPTGLGQMGKMAGGQLLKTFAFMGQYIVPAAFLFGALASILGQRKRSHLHETVARHPTANALNHMSWREFEMLVGEAFRRRGFAVSETGGSADGGVDVILTRGGETFLVQCKQWKAFKVGVSIVRELYGVMAAQGAAGGFVVTSGVFTQDARQFAAGRNIELVDGAQLHAMIRGVEPPRHGRPDSHLADTPKTASAPRPTPGNTAPACPACGTAMVLRQSKKGQNAGNQFWGCPQFPACRGTRPA